jgi:zinc protease
MRKVKWMQGNVLAVTLVLAGCATVETAPVVTTAVRTPVAAPAPAWPHQASDLKADDKVRFGILPNGMRYALMRNATPPGAASVRLRFDAGSLYERDDQQGLAHFLEHMTLNETKNFPEGELIKVLERAGLKFGPDTNAFTSFEQTVYMLDLPKTDPATVDTGLHLMREVAGEATLSASAIDSERNIILSEERTRASPGYKMAIDEIGNLFRDDLLAKRIPIGQTEVIRTAPAQRLIDFYNGYYRPERATLIAVGDFDVAEMEAKVRARFSDWQGRGAPAPEPAAPVLPDRGVETRVFVEPGVPSRVSMSWVSPLDARPDSLALRSQRIVEQLALQIINRRMERLANSSAKPFLGGGAARQRQGLRGEVTQIIGVSESGKWQPALAAIEQEQRRAVEHGFTQSELAREITEMRTAFTAAAAGAATRPSPNIAMGLVNAVNEDRVFLAPSTNLQIFEAAVKGLQAEQVTTAARRLFSGSGPLVYLASPVPVETGEKALLSAFNQSRLSPVTAPAVQQAKAWPYKDFGPAGVVLDRREIAGTGATAVRFKNGVRLTVKPTTFKNDEILVSARFGEGQLGLAKQGPNPTWGLGGGGFTGGGLGELTFEELQEVLAGVSASADAGVDEHAFTLSGRTRPQDFATQLQLLAAYVKDPAWRPTMWDRLRSYGGTIHNQLETSPSGVFQRDAQALLRSGDPRWATPSREQMAGMTVGEMRAAIEDDVRSGPLEVIIVGDISVDEAIRQTAATFGALPTRMTAPASPAAQAVRFPGPATVTRTHAGREDQALAFIGWPTTGFYADQRQARGLNLLSQILQLRLNDEIREKQGAAYSPNARHSPSQDIRGYGYMAAQIETPPASVEGFYRDVMSIARDLRERPVTEDELQRARKPLVEGLQRSRSSSNEWWLGNLAGVHEQPERAESIRVGIEQYAAITPAELQQLARKYLVEAKAWKMAVTPQKK